VHKKTQHRVEYIAFRIIEKAIQSLPGFILKPFADFIAFIAFKVAKYRREVALENLANAFPEKSPEDRFQIAYGSYRHFALVILEFMKLASWTPEQLEKMIDIERTQEIENMLAKTRGKGAIVVSGHFGNWEMVIAYLASRFFEGASVIQLRQKNALIDRHVSDMRRRWGIEIIYSRGAVNNALVSLKGDQFLGLLCDQDAGMRGAFVPFFGRMASTPVGAAVLHLRSKATLFFGFSVRVGKFKYKGYVTPIEHDSDYEVNTENIQKITAKFTAQLEKYVRQYPDQYLWMHRRWKTQPEGEKQLS
jgi:KDO2-lipid IV(A) lauroyltransferase